MSYLSNGFVWSNLSDLLIYLHVCLVLPCTWSLFFHYRSSQGTTGVSFGDQARQLVTFPKTNVCQLFTGFLGTKSHGKKWEGWCWPDNGFFIHFLHFGTSDVQICWFGGQAQCLTWSNKLLNRSLLQLVYFIWVLASSVIEETGCHKRTYISSCFDFLSQSDVVLGGGWQCFLNKTIQLLTFVTCWMLEN